MLEIGRLHLKSFPLCSPSVDFIVYPVPQHPDRKNRDAGGTGQMIASGKLIANKEYHDILKGKIVWNANLMGKGVCFYKVKVDGSVFAGNVVVGK
jgi:hypothetical protein